MALTKSTLLAEIRGSIAGSTFGRNRGGIYIRSRSVPINPGSEFQAAVRASLGLLSARWRDTLTNAQRAAWDAYALNTPRTNALGDPINIGGIGAYVRGNVSRIQAGLSIVDDGPASFGIPEIGAVTVAAASATTLSIGFDSTDPWASTDDTALLIYVSANQSPAKNFFKGPYRFAQAVEGSSTLEPTSPAVVTSPYEEPYTDGQQVFLRCTVIDEQGRLSDDSLARAVLELP